MQPPPPHPPPHRLVPGAIWGLTVLSCFATLITDSQRVRVPCSHTPCPSWTVSSLTAPTLLLKVTFYNGVEVENSRWWSATLKFFFSLPPFFALDHVTFMSKKFVDWLRYASITQGSGASSGGFFTGPRSRQVSWICTFSSPFFLLIVCVHASVSHHPSPSWMGQCRGISSLSSAWARASPRTSGWMSTPSPCFATGFSLITLFPMATAQSTQVKLGHCEEVVSLDVTA